MKELTDWLAVWQARELTSLPAEIRARALVSDKSATRVKSEAYVALSWFAQWSALLSHQTMVLLKAVETKLAEEIMSMKGGGAVALPLGGGLVVGAGFDLKLKIDDLAPAEALVPGAVGFDLTIAAAEESAEQRLIARLDAIGAGGLARRRVDYEALAAWVDGHEGGAAKAVQQMMGVLTVESRAVLEVIE